MAVVRWRFRMAAAQREIWTGAQLRCLLAEKAGLELSAASVSALLTNQPVQVKLETLAALCTALDCTPNDLMELDATASAAPAKTGTAADRTGSAAGQPAPGHARARGGTRTPPPF